MLVSDLDAGRLGGDVGQLVDGHHSVPAEVERLGVVRVHEAVDALDTVVDVHERAGLLAVAPDLDGRVPARSALLAAEELRVGHLPHHRGGSLLPSTLPRPEFAVDVVEPDGPGLHPVVALVIVAEELGEELLPTVGVLRGGRVRVVLLERRRVGRGLEMLRVDARRGGVEVAGDPGLPCRLEGVRVDEDVVVEDEAVVRRDEPHPAHVGREGVDVVDLLAVGRRADGLQARVPATEVEEVELVGRRLFELRPLDVDAADPVAALLEVLDEVMADESTGASDENASHEGTSCL